LAQIRRRSQWAANRRAKLTVAAVVVAAVVVAAVVVAAVVVAAVVVAVALEVTSSPTVLRIARPRELQNQMKVGLVSDLAANQRAKLTVAVVVLAASQRAKLTVVAAGLEMMKSQTLLQIARQWEPQNQMKVEMASDLAANQRA
jgi:hypothetical protein